MSDTAVVHVQVPNEPDVASVPFAPHGPAAAAPDTPTDVTPATVNDVAVKQITDNTPRTCLPMLVTCT